MAFWTDSSLQPLRNFRFRIQTPYGPFQGLWWWTKSVDLPNYDVNVNEYQLGNHKFKYPGVLTWQDVTITVVDTATVANKLLQSLIAMGYKKPENTINGGLSKDPRIQSPITVDGQAKIGTFLNESVITDVIIEQLKEDGKTHQFWQLKNAFVKSVNFGRLAYEDDGLQEITITFSYDYIDYEFFAAGDITTVTVGRESSEDNGVEDPFSTVVDGALSLADEGEEIYDNSSTDVGSNVKLEEITTFYGGGAESEEFVPNEATMVEE